MTESADYSPRPSPTIEPSPDVKGLLDRPARPVMVSPDYEGDRKGVLRLRKLWGNIAFTATVLLICGAFYFAVTHIAVPRYTEHSEAVAFTKARYQWWLEYRAEHCRVIGPLSSRPQFKCDDGKTYVGRLQYKGGGEIARAPRDFRPNQPVPGFKRPVTSSVKTKSPEPGAPSVYDSTRP